MVLKEKKNKETGKGRKGRSRKRMEKEDLGLWKEEGRKNKDYGKKSEGRSRIMERKEKEKQGNLEGKWRIRVEKGQQR